MSQGAAKGKAVRAGLWLAGLCAVLVGGAAAGAESPTLCRTACERHVTDTALRLRICDRCAARGADRAAWVLGLVPKAPAERTILEVALRDPDWRVGRAAARMLSRDPAVTRETILSRWLVRAQGADLERACLTVSRIGAERGRSFAEWRKNLSASGGKAGHHAFTVLGRCEPRVRERLELEIYRMNPVAQEEALRHLAVLTARSPAAAALDALRGRPQDSDAVVAEVLLRVTPVTDPPVGRALMQLETKVQQRFAKRLVAIYRAQAKQILQRLDADPEAGTVNRGDAVRDLAPLAPISAPELERFLGDPEQGIRLAAARAIAAGEGASGACTEQFVSKVTAAGTESADHAAALKALKACGSSR